MDTLLDSRCRVRETEHLWIGMPDGVRLSARLWLPDDDAAHPVPALFEYIPYRKADMVRARDERNHPYFAAQGYACLRVDMRGSGDSEGHLPDMYAPEELADARHVIEWIAAQPWCDGSVGMFGTSWGGTASLQASIDAPKALKAIIAVCATHDRYEDDIHHKGGLILTDSIEWGATLPAILALPPSALAAGPSWRDRWRERLESLTFPLEHWVREEERSAYWQHGSVKFQAERISCPILAVGGWSDRYSNSVMSLVECCPKKVWGVVGPWGHHYPDVGHPGPSIGFQQEALRWWDLWLKSEGDARSDWPRLRVWLQDFDPPQDVLHRRNGAWIEVDSPANEAATRLTLMPAGSTLKTDGPLPAARQAIPYDLKVGASAGDTGYFGRYGGLPTDQNGDDERSLAFETDPLSEPVVLFGAAELEFELASDQPLAQIAVRLVDVAPNGAAARVCLALRNLALSDDLCIGAPIQPGRARRYVVKFHTKAHRFAAGHRIRLSFSSSYWPMAWPSPHATNLVVTTGSATRLHLPILAEAPQPLGRPFPVPLDPPAVARYDQLTAPSLSRSAAVDADGRLTSTWHQPFASQRFHATETAFGYETRAHHSLRPDDSNSVKSRFDHRLQCARPDGVAEVTSWAEVTATPSAFLLSGGLSASWNGLAVSVRRWSPKIARRCS
ncbi:MAG: CocE/NonD family hydrolase [Pseudomonadota bacterium]